MTLDTSLLTLPKAELHVHVEGTMTPSLARDLAKHHNLHFPDDLVTPDGRGFIFKDFLDLVTRVYQAVAHHGRARADYELIVYDYLRRCAAESTLYVEISCAPSQTLIGGISYTDMIEGMADGIDRARKDFGIEARIITTLVRHMPIDMVWQDARLIAATDHPYLVGLDVAGGESDGDVPSLAPLLDHIRNHFGRDLGLRLHAGENAGPTNIRAAIDLGATRIGHGVRAVEDPELMDELIQRNITLEVCPTSNILARIYPDFASHGLHKIIAAGVPFTLNSDDPGLFGNSIGEEYQLGRDAFGMSRDALLATTQRSLEVAFCDDALKQALLARLTERSAEHQAA